MENSDEEPPLAVEINDAVNSNQLTKSSKLPPVGVTVITGYLGSGKSTVIYASPLLIQFIIRLVSLELKRNS